MYEFFSGKAGTLEMHGAKLTGIFRIWATGIFEI
jgi:hypothetical protein